MDHSAIADRRQLRRKLTFWRVAAVLIALAAVLSAVAWRWPGGGALLSMPEICRRHGGS